MIHYFAEIEKARFDDNKTTLQITLDENILKDLQKYQSKFIEIAIADNRTIRPDQRKKIFATIDDIMDTLGDSKEHWVDTFKCKVIANTGCNDFSLSNCTVTTAREFINEQIKFCIEQGIPLMDYGVNRTDDIDYYLYKCIENRVCCITGKPNADIHHVLGSRVGMGRNRNKIDHTDLELMALSREWHTKVHAEGEEKIFQDFKIYGIKVSQETLKELGLNVKEID